MNPTQTPSLTEQYSAAMQGKVTDLGAVERLAVTLTQAGLAHLGRKLRGKLAELAEVALDAAGETDAEELVTVPRAELESLASAADKLELERTLAAEEIVRLQRSRDASERNVANLQQANATLNAENASLRAELDAARSILAVPTGA